MQEETETRSFRELVRARAATPAAAGAAAGSVGAAGASLPKVRRAVAHIPLDLGLIDFTEAKTFMPPGARASIWHERASDRARVSFIQEGVKLTHSQSIAKRGVEAAIGVCLKWLWDEWEKAGNGPCPYEWPEGL